MDQRSKVIDSFLSTKEDSSRIDDSGYDNKEEKIDTLRKKLKILKTALLKERQAKSLVESEVQELRRKFELLTSELDEKDKNNLKLHREIDELQEKLIQERNNLDKVRRQMGGGPENKNLLTIANSNDKGLFSSMGSIFGFGGNNPPKEEKNSNLSASVGINPNMSGDMKTLQTEYNYVKKQHDALMDKYKKLEDSIDSIKRDQKYEQEKIEKKLEKSLNDLNDKENQVRMMTQDLRNACQSNITLLDEKEKMERDMKELHDQNERISNAKYQLSCLLEEKIKNMSQLQELLLTSQKEASEMSEKIISLNQNITEMEGKIQIFKLNKFGNVGALTKLPTQLILRRDINGIYIMEFETPVEKTIMEAADVLNLIPDKSKENKFTLVYLNKLASNQQQNDVYETEEDLKKVCKIISRFLQNAQEFRKLNPEKSLVQAKKDNKVGFLGDIVSFFGN